MSGEQLQQAYQLIKNGQKDRALEILDPIVAAEPDNADAWWLLANARSDVDFKREAAQQVLRLRPDHAKARLMLQRLSSMDEIEDLLEDLFEAPVVSTGRASSSSSGGQRIVVTRPKGQNNSLLIVLAIIGVVVVVGCGFCLIFSSGIATVFQDIITDPNVVSFVNQMQAESGFDTLPNTVNQRGQIEIGQSANASASFTLPDAWTFDGSAGDTYTIEVDATDSSFDPVVYLYGPDKQLVGTDDDGGTDLNSHLVVRLRASGQQTIVVSAVGAAGSYQITLQRGAV